MRGRRALPPMRVLPRWSEAHAGGPAAPAARLSARGKSVCSKSGFLFLQELRDVDLVVADLEAAAGAIVHHDVPAPGGLPARRAAGAAAVEAGRDHGHT